MDWQSSDAPHNPAPAAMQQHPVYGAVCQALGRTVSWMRLGAADDAKGVALILHARLPGVGRVALLSRGPIWAGDLPADTRKAALHHLVAHLRRSHVAVIATPDPVEGQDPLADRPLLELVTPMTIAALDIVGDRTVQRSRLHGKWRNSLARAEERPLRTAALRLPDDEKHWLLHHEATQATSRGYRRLSPGFALAWARQSPATTLLMAGYHAGVPVAGMLFLRHGTTATYHIGWSGAAGRSLGAHRRLLWEAIGRLSDMGVTRLELGAIDTVTNPDLARFKLGTGARPLRLGATRFSAPATGLVSRTLGLADRVRDLAPWRAQHARPMGQGNRITR
jgi:hypothetical protein